MAIASGRFDRRAVEDLAKLLLVGFLASRRGQQGNGLIRATSLHLRTRAYPKHRSMFRFPETSRLILEFFPFTDPPPPHNIPSTRMDAVTIADAKVCEELVSQRQLGWHTLNRLDGSEPSGYSLRACASIPFFSHEVRCPRDKPDINRNRTFS